MRTPDLIVKEIVACPESDELRRELAEAVRSENPAWALFIERGLERDYFGYTRDELPEALERELKLPFERYGEIGLEFERGLPVRAYVPVTSFLNHGNEILSLAPILEVALVIDDETSVIRHWNDLLPDLTNCSALARVRGLSLDSRADFDFVSMKHIIRSAHIESLVRLSPGVWRLDSPHALEEEDEMWSLLLNSPVFRRMVDWGLRTEVTDHRAGFYAPTVTSLLTRRQLGDRMVKEPYGTSGEVTRFEQMSEESRALEQKYGYIPYFHAGNWTATVLDVLQGRKPEFPAGAAPTKEMYDVPPTRDHADTGW